jgi:hypothetical protein
MKLVFSSIADRGNPKSERIVLKARSRTDVGAYAILRAAADGEVVTNAIDDTFWFPDKGIEDGDIVVVYTKAGVQSEKALKSGKRAHSSIGVTPTTRYGKLQSMLSSLCILMSGCLRSQAYKPFRGSAAH